MYRRQFLKSLALAAAGSQLGCATTPGSATGSTRRLKRVGIQLYTLRDQARVDLERTLTDIASVGYHDIELLGSMNNFGMEPTRLRAILDRVGLRAPSTHVSGNIVDNLDRALADAKTLGHQYLTVASLPISGTPTLDDFRRWADRLNEAGRRTLADGVYMAFHNHAGDHRPIDGTIPYDVFVERTDPALVRLQLDTGNTAMAGHDPIEYLRRYRDRYWSFHIKDVPRFGATADTELGKGVIDFRKLLAEISRIDEKLLFVEQETYPGPPLDSVRRDFTYISTLEF